VKRFVLLALVLLLGCSKLRRSQAKADGRADAAAPVTADPAPTVAMLEAKDLPLGHWETTDGDKVCLTILPDGLVRFATPVPHYRNAARVFGQVTHVEGDDADTFRVWVEVTKILAKEVGRCHRHWEDYELFEAEILGTRVTSPNVNGHHVPELGGKGEPAPPPSYKLKFDESREHLELCTLARTPVCRALKKEKSPSDFSRVRPGIQCKTDDDCIIVTDGEQCDPCLCPSKASSKRWPHKTDPDQDDPTWETKQEHLCGKDLPRKPTCPACPELRAVCKHQFCVLKP
jgi:hypothetical protein